MTSCCLHLGVLLVGLMGASPDSQAISTAREHLQAGRLDEVLFTLEGKPFQGRDAAVAADLLGAAGRQSLARQDGLLALQFCQMALKLARSHPAALEVAARASLGQKQFDPAEDYADRLLQATGRAPGSLVLRAEIAVEEGDWSHGLSLISEAEAAGLAPGDRAIAERIRKRAGRELAERKAGLSTARDLERQIAVATKRAAAELAARKAPPAVAPRSGDGAEVIVYGTSWCGYCRKARQWLSARKIPFVEKDVEKDRGAREELATKALAAGIRPQGVPVIDVRGRLIQGFNAAALERLLR